MSKLLRRVWAEIDLDTLDANIEYIKKTVGDKAVMAVVKADACCTKWSRASAR